MLDMSKYDIVALATRLKWHQGKCIINSTLEKVGDDLFKDHARLLKNKHGAAFVMVTFNEEGQAMTEDGKLHISKCTYNCKVCFFTRI